MRKLKLALCLAFIAIFGAFELLHTNNVAGQIGGTTLSAPTGVIASDGVYNNKITVWWDTIRGATSYRIFRSTTNSSATATDVGIMASNSFIDNGIPAGQTAFYWVRAENGASVSDLSTPDQGTRTNTVGGPAQPLPPPPPAPAGNAITATKAYLGKALFWDEQLSSTNTVSCGSCHHSGNGGTDPRSVVATTASTNPGADAILGTQDDVRGSQGVPNNNPDGTYINVANYGLNNQVTGRKTVSYVNAGYPQLLFWDGRATGVFRDPITNLIVLNGGAALESQVLGPPTSTAEMGHNGRDWNNVAAKIASAKPLAIAPAIPTALNTWINGRTYPELFLEAFGTTEVTPSRIAMAIATFERTLYTDQTPFDLDAQGITPLSAAAQRGRGIFNGGAACNVCHAGALFSDNAFHYIGVRPQNDDTGRFQVTGQNQNIGEMRTPSLRNVALRGSFFHNGQFTTLGQVVAFYNRGGDFNAPNKAPQIRPLGLNQNQQNDLVAFLQSLTDPRLTAESAPFDRPALYTESTRVPEITGTSLAGSGGITPQIKIISPPYAGNPNFTVSLSGALGNASAMLAISTADTGTRIPRATAPRFAFPRVTATTANTGSGNGWTSVSISIPDSVRTNGYTFYARWYITDPAAPGGYSITPAAKFTVFIPSTAIPSTVFFSSGSQESVEAIETNLVVGDTKRQR